MIGNFEKCPCGSGEIVQDCCGKTNETGTNQIQIELKNVLNSYYETSLAPAEVQELETLLKEWGGRLGDWMEEEELVTNVSDYYFFIVRKDLWRRHLVKALNRTQNKAVRQLLKSWQNSFITFAEVVSSDDQVYRMKEILGDGEYVLAKEPGEPSDIQAVLAIVLEEWRNEERHVMPISAIAVNEHMSKELVAQVQKLAETGAENNSFEFFKKHLVDIYEFVCKLDAQTLTDVVEQNFTPLQREVVELLDEKLECEEMYPGAYEMLLSLMAYYFTDQQPRFRKPEVLAAAAFQLAVDLDMMMNTYTQKEISTMFGVSTSSYKKHTDALMDKIEELEEMMNEGTAGVAYYVGTDPRPTEQTNWQIHMLSSKHNFETLEEAQAFIQQAIQQPFEPENQQQEAQMLCYMAFHAETVEQRHDFAQQAFGADPTNVDALLLQAEYTDSPEEKEKLYKQAVFSGEKQFDNQAEDAWAFAPNRPYLRSLLSYGVWLYSNERYVESSEIFMRLLTLDLYDHQGARYLAISSLIFQDEIEQAKQVHEACAEISQEDAAYHYLAWLIEMDATQGESSRSAEFFKKAERLNPYVGALIHAGAEKMPYPKSASVKPGTPEEAYYIWFML
ncbi:hypothetical protein DV702_15615 [Sporosarcina sp. PTS2304]|uniref:hypothetical protein n=1 Tax=Sporosarcina sp. PTS2304 TaxID=2283194 RepID=UPI000E0D8DB2|nr:hypothetical protein [Sporosarcina sp. PTS2304]AXI01017.1 hypothetical protein DV702_15615 [Sporosarcina sp. PTS2304]